MVGWSDDRIRIKGYSCSAYINHPKWGGFFAILLYISIYRVFAANPHHTESCDSAPPPKKEHVVLPPTGQNECLRSLGPKELSEATPPELRWGEKAVKALEEIHEHD